MGPSTHDTDRSWLDITARLPWWAWVVLAVVTVELIRELPSLAMARAGGRAFWALVDVLCIAIPALFLGAGAGSAWARARSAALHEVDVPAPNEAEVASAREAGQVLVARGKLGLVLGGGGAKGAYQVGCWKALRACGVTQFSAVAGTSVGALNAVLVAQGDYDKAESIWHNMSFGRVLRLRWHALLAVLIRVVLIVPYLGKLMFPARAIPVAMWRAVCGYRDGQRQGDPRRQIVAAWQLYRVFAGRADSTNMVGNIVLAAIGLAGLSAWWLLAAPVLTVVAMVVAAPLVALLVVTYASWFVTMLDQFSTRLVLATNEPLHQLLLDCVDVARLDATNRPLFVTLASLREVTRTVTPPPRRFKETAELQLEPKDASPPSWWKENVIGDGPNADYVIPVGLLAPYPVTTVEYVPSHFNVRTADAGMVHELILQSAGLPEIFPARRIGEYSYVDGGIVDNVPLTALADVPDQAAILVVPLDARLDEDAVRKDLAANLERLGRSAPKSLPELVLLTPSRPLGNFLTGTLDFGAVRARALMQLGYCDTIRRLAQRSNIRARDAR